MQKVKLSIIVPVFNEENTVYLILEKLVNLKLPANVDDEIIVINDGSTDASLSMIKKAQAKFNGRITVVNHKANSGKGSAVVSGIDKSSGEIITIQDADLEYNPQDIIKILNKILGKDIFVVYGTRLKNFPLKISGQKKTPLITHYLGNKLLTVLTNVLYGSSVTDMETCYKMMKREVLKGINLRSKRFELEPELTAKILKKGYKIYEVPILVKPRGYEEGKKITWKDGFMALWTLIKYRFVD